VPFDKEPESLGEKIIYYRWLKDVTQKELARQLNVDPTTLARWERDERFPQEMLLILLNEKIKA